MPLSFPVSDASSFVISSLRFLDVEVSLTSCYGCRNFCSLHSQDVDLLDCFSINVHSPIERLGVGAASVPIVATII